MGLGEADRRRTSSPGGEGAAPREQRAAAGRRRPRRCGQGQEALTRGGRGTAAGSRELRPHRLEASASRDLRGRRAEHQAPISLSRLRFDQGQAQAGSRRPRPSQVDRGGSAALHRTSAAVEGHPPGPRRRAARALPVQDQGPRSKAGAHAGVPAVERQVPRSGSSRLRRARAALRRAAERRPGSPGPRRVLSLRDAGRRRARRPRAGGSDPVLYGNWIVIDASGTRTDYRYAHFLHPASVREGERVRTGDEVGRIGRTGNARSVGCMLHFEVWPHGWNRGAPVDPLPILKRWDGWS
jgi:Peptidase family M23